MAQTHRVAVMAGDGIGREVMPEGLKVLEAAAEAFGLQLEFHTFDWASCDYYLQHGAMLPDNWHETLRNYDAIYFGAVGWPQTVPDHISLWGSLLQFRRGFDQYVNLRPVRLFEGVSCPLAGKKAGDIDFMIVRENTEGEYSSVGGRMFEGTERELVLQEAVFTRHGVDRILKFAFDLAQTRELDVNSRIDSIIPEIKDSAYQGATVRHLLDMRVGVDFDEDYLATAGAIIEYRKAQGWNPLAPGDSARNLRDFFPILTETDGSHGERFHYASPNTDLLGWVLERVSGKRFADLLSDLIWQPLGAEQNAYITVDRTGAPRCAGGICTTARDLARVGRLFVTQGRANGKQIIPAEWLEDILTAGDRQAWQDGDFFEFYEGASMHYRSKWYVEHGPHTMVFGLGVFGQNVFVEPENDLVIVKFSSQPLPLDQGFNSLTHRGINVLRGLLR